MDCESAPARSSISALKSSGVASFPVCGGYQLDGGIMYRPLPSLGMEYLNKKATRRWHNVRMDDQTFRIIGVVVFWMGIVPAVGWLKRHYFPKGIGYAMGSLLGRTRKRAKRAGRQLL